MWKTRYPCASFSEPRCVEVALYELLRTDSQPRPSLLRSLSRTLVYMGPIDGCSCVGVHRATAAPTQTVVENDPTPGVFHKTRREKPKRDVDASGGARPMSGTVVGCRRSSSL